MDTNARERALDVLQFFRSDRTARESLGVQGPDDFKYIAAAEVLVELASASECSQNDLRDYTRQMALLLEKQTDGRAEILAEKALRVLHGNLGSTDGHQLRRAICVARARRLVGYFDRLTIEEGERWRSNLDCAKELLHLAEDPSTSRGRYDALLARLVPEGHQAGSGFSELVSTCREFRQLSPA